MSNEPTIASEAVLIASSKLPDDTPIVAGYDWNNGIDYDKLLSSYLNSGFQATNFGKAIKEIDKMVTKNMSFLNMNYFGHLDNERFDFSWTVETYRWRPTILIDTKTMNLFDVNPIAQFFLVTHLI